MLNPDLEPETVALLLKVMIQLTLMPRPNEEAPPSCLETIGKLLKADLNKASQKEDIAFIK